MTGAGTHPVHKSSTFRSDPADHRSPGKARLRLMYEANPMAFLVEQAGGAANNGYERILDVVPKSLHERVGVILGDKLEVATVAAYGLELEEAAHG